MSLPSAKVAALFVLGLVACTSNLPDTTPMKPARSSGGSTGGTAGMSTGGTGGAPLACNSVVPGVAPLRLLTHVQYDNTVADLLGDTSSPSSQFPAENEVVGFRNNVAANQVNPRLIEAYQAAAERLASTAVGTRLATLAPCADGADMLGCGHSFIADFGAKAFRRALSTEESESFAKLFDSTLTDGYPKAVELTLRALLQAPQFLYRVDALHAATPETGAVELAPYEMASRLSYFLTNSTPDSTLLAAASHNQLRTESELEAQARRLLDTARAREMAADFVGQWLGLARLDGAARSAGDDSFGDSELIPDWKDTLGRFLNDALWNAGDVKALMTSPKLFLTPKLATLYGLPAPADPNEPASLPAERSGLLTQPAIMALLAHADQSAPVLRGVFVRERILCLEVDPPPPEVVPVPPEVDQSATTRERFAQHTAQASCRGCHAIIDGIGFGFERYDQLGRFRETENGLGVDDSGEVLDSGDSALEGPFDGAGDLAQKLGVNAGVRDCIATQWYRYAMGRVEDSSDACSLQQVKSRFASGKGAFRELLVGIVLSDAFRYRPALESQ